MAKRRFKLNKTELDELQIAYRKEADTATRTRYQAVRMYGSGYELTSIKDITGCTRSSLMIWCRTYQAKGVAELADKRLGGNNKYLTNEQISNLQSKLHEYTPRDLPGPQEADRQYWQLEDLKRVIEQWYGVVYKSNTSYYTVFRRIGFSLQQPGKIYKSRRLKKVIEFEAEIEKNSLT